MSFLAYFFGTHEDRNEIAVRCPFPHVVPDTNLTYMEQHPSAHVNLEKGMFHCKACGRGHSEASFIKEILGCSYNTGVRLSAAFKQNESENLDTWLSETRLTDENREQLHSLGVSDAVINELHICTAPTGASCFPVFMYDKLLDIRIYTPNGRPKVTSRTGAMSGLILPYDEWRVSKENRTTLICAGEKDMANARSHGFNAITITGGESALPITTSEFKNRNVIICYDNDAAGKLGATRLATYLMSYTKSVKICTEFHEVCKENKEDITDFFVKYGKTRDDLITYLQRAKDFVPSEESETNIPMVDLHTASQPQYIGRMVRSNVQVVATSESTFVAPAAILATKTASAPNAEEGMVKDEVRSWEMTDDNVQDILHMIDNNFTEATIKKNYRDLLKIMQKEKYVRMTVTSKQTIYKCYVTDMFETTNTEVVPMEYTVYTVGTKLESGKKYLVTYKLVPHPYKGQQLTMLVTHAQQASDSVSQFKVTEETKEHLKIFQSIEGDVDTRINRIIQKFKGIIGYDGNTTLIKTMDLAYHTPLNFKIPTAPEPDVERGYLDVLIIGESRMGKSSTANAMRKAYDIGTFTSLAGNAATVPGLIGGSNKTQGSYQTRAGIIPQNHRGLIIFEELGKSQSNILKELTDIRSSNEVRIARVSGSITLPATVRMITLTNVKTMDGVIKPIAQYPHGVSILTELIGTAEDIARYDIALVLGDKGATYVDPSWRPEEPFPLEALRSRVRWVWSRTIEQIVISEEIRKSMVDHGNELNKNYGCHIKIFGPEAWKKVARVAIAAAGYLVSTDDTHENIIVKEEHVAWAANYLKDIYDNETFKLRQYVVFERRYSEIDDDGIELLQGLFIKAPALLLQLEQTAQTTKNTLLAASGMTQDEYNGVMNRLVSGMFVTFSKYDIIPTERFRLGIARINRNTRAVRVGEPNET